MDCLCPVLLGCLIALQLAAVHSEGHIPVTVDGFASARSSRNGKRMRSFVGRAIALFGGRIHDVAGLLNFSRTYHGSSQKQFGDLMSEIMLHPRWATWDENAACVANRSATAAVVGQGIAYACSNMLYFDCQKVPVTCTAAESNVWIEADYIFSVYFNEKGAAPYPTCHMGGAAIFQPPSAYLPPAAGVKSGCVATKSPLTAPITDEGYHAVMSQKNATKTKTYIVRVATSRMSGEIKNHAQLQDWSSNPPQDFQSLLKWLPALFEYPTASGTMSFGLSWSIVLGMLDLVQRARHVQ